MDKKDIAGNTEGNPPAIHLEVKTEADITPEDIAQLDDIAEQSTIEFEQAEHNSSEFQELGTVVSVHDAALKVVKKGKDEKDSLRVVFARNEQGKIVGYSVVVLNPQVSDPAEKVDNTFLGVVPEYQRQNIGTYLLQARHQQLSVLGIPSYMTKARDSAIGLYKKLGVRHEVGERESAIAQGRPVKVFVS